MYKEGGSGQASRILAIRVRVMVQYVQGVARSRSSPLGRFGSLPPDARGNAREWMDRGGKCRADQEKIKRSACAAG